MAAKKEGGHNWKRSLTISSGTPLKHRDKGISEETREKFQALDLEVLLGEFKAVALLKESQPFVEEESESTRRASYAGESEREWLNSAGLSTLTEKISLGQVITDEDVRTETAGLTPLQVHAVKERCVALNGTIKMREHKGRGDSRSLFPEASSQPTGTNASTGTANAATNAASSTTSSATSSVRPLTAVDIMAESFDIDPETRHKIEQLCDDSVVKFSDFSVDDQQQIHNLMLIQLTSILEQQNSAQKLKPNTKPKKKKKVVGTFEEDLEALVERDRVVFGDKLKDQNVPMFFQRAIESLTKNGVREEGIFRKAGAAARIKTLRTKCDELRGDVDFDAIGAVPHDISALVKQFVRDLPEPLLTSGFIEAFACTQQFEDTELGFYTLQLLVMLLPQINRDCLLALLRFLGLVASQHQYNKMGLSNLAVVFAPTLFYIRGYKGQQMLKEVEIQVSSATTLKTMIEFHHLLLNVPCDIIAQLRFLNETKRSAAKASKPKHVKKLFSKPKLKGEYDDVPVVQWVQNSSENPPLRGIITITVAETPVIIENVKIYDHTVAADVLKLAAVDPTKYFLVEKGGNIGARKLDGLNRLMQVFKINPGAALQIASSLS